MKTKTAELASSKDYFLVAFIGLSFALFSIPILNNVQLSFLKLSFSTISLLIIFFVLFAVLAMWVAALISRRIPIIFQLAKFAASGAFNTFLDWGILNLFMAFFGITAGIGYVLFKGTSFTAATVSSYIWNKYWTFEAKNSANPQEFWKFIAVSIVGFIINISLAAFIVNVIHPLGGITPARWANIGALCATALSMIWNFVGYKILVFKK